MNQMLILGAAVAVIAILVIAVVVLMQPQEPAPGPQLPEPEDTEPAPQLEPTPEPEIENRTPELVISDVPVPDEPQPEAESGKGFICLFSFESVLATTDENFGVEKFMAKSPNKLKIRGAQGVWTYSSLGYGSHLGVLGYYLKTDIIFDDESAYMSMPEKNPIWYVLDSSNVPYLETEEGMSWDEMKALSLDELRAELEEIDGVTCEEVEDMSDDEFEVPESVDPVPIEKLSDWEESTPDYCGDGTCAASEACDDCADDCGSCSDAAFVLDVSKTFGCDSLFGTADEFSIKSGVCSINIPFEIKRRIEDLSISVTCQSDVNEFYFGEKDISFEDHYTVDGYVAPVVGANTFTVAVRDIGFQNRALARLNLIEEEEDVPVFYWWLDLEDNPNAAEYDYPDILAKSGMLYDIVNTSSLFFDTQYVAKVSGISEDKMTSSLEVAELDSLGNTLGISFIFHNDFEEFEDTLTCTISVESLEPELSKSKSLVMTFS